MGDNSHGKNQPKGLKRLRWYCQMCRRQCGDEIAFKNHTRSEGHLRQMDLFNENSDMFLTSFTEQFKTDFVKLLSVRYGTKKVNINHVYTEYIKDREHVHMNSTIWSSLFAFGRHLGEVGICKVEDVDEEGILIEWIDTSPGSVSRRNASSLKHQFDKDIMEQDRELIEQQIERGKQALSAPEPVFSEFNRSGAKIELSLIKSSTKTMKLPHSLKAKSLAALHREQSGQKRPSSFQDHNSPSISDKKLKGLNGEHSWVIKDIVVKITAKGPHHGQKGIVSAISGESITLKMLDNDHETPRICAADLETVIPAIGGSVKVLKGAHRGFVGILKDIDVDSYCGSIVLSSGDKLSLPYENFCKINS